MRIAIIDYGMGNLGSVLKAYSYLGYNAFITNDPMEVIKADKVTLPGVGAFDHAMKNLRKSGLDKTIIEITNKGVMLLGICLGMQLLFDKSYENGLFEGLGILEGDIVRFKDGINEKVPHIGWNSLNIQKRDPLFKDLGDNPYVYFVHSYHLQTNSDIVSANTYYGYDIQVAVQKDNVMALQFHPEKSGETGLTILKNFALL